LTAGVILFVIGALYRHWSASIGHELNHYQTHSTGLSSCV